MLTRALIVLLLVLNLGVAAWWWLRPPPPAPPAPAQLEGVPRLRLVGEAGPVAAAPVASTPASPAPASSSAVPAAPPETDADRAAIADPAAATPALPAAPTPGSPPQRCFAFGPYADQASAQAARAALQPRATRLQLRSEPRPARGGSWDVVLPQPDRASAQAMAQRIEAAGFRDYYVIGEGAAANGIALGRFGSEESARRHQAALQAAGFAAQVQGPPAAASRLWLDVAAGADFDADAARRAASAARVQPADCDALG